MTSPRKIVVVAGPTASGKSELALGLARSLGGEIINLDSAQVYREFDIGTAKMETSERKGIPHHLIDIAAPEETFNVAKYLELLPPLLAAIEGRGKVPIFVGGTTMYLTALLHGLAALPSNADLRAELEKRDTADLLEELRERDESAATRLHANDRLRIMRALEASILLGEAGSEVLSRHAHKEVLHTGLILALAWPRAELYKRIDLRASEMVARGLIEETDRLRSRYGDTIQGLRSVGYAESLSYLRGEITQEEVAPLIATHTRQFAKRQMTFWRNEPQKRGWQVIPPQDEAPVVQLKKGGMYEMRGLELGFDELAKRVKERMEGGCERPEVWMIDGRFLREEKKSQNPNL